MRQSASGSRFFSLGVASARVRRLRFLLQISICWLVVIGYGSPSLAAPPRLALQSVVTGLVNPIGIETPNDGTGRLFIVEQRGSIRILQGGVLLAQPFLNLIDQIESGGERGLLGLAFHPSYQANGRFFVNYTRRVDTQLQSVIAEYHVS